MRGKKPKERKNYVSEVSFYNYDIEYKQKNGKIFGE